MKKIISVLVAVAVAVGVAATPASASYCGITWGSGAKAVADKNVNEELTNVRTGQHSCYDRMVLDINASGAGYDVRYVSNVYAEGSGALIPLSGGAKLRIIARSPNHDTQTGKITYNAATGKVLPGVNLTGYKTFRQAKFAGSFEGQSTVGLGVRARLPFRAFKSGNNIVVDVAHYW